MKQNLKVRTIAAIMVLAFAPALIALGENMPPDLTKGITVDRTRTYNLGSTGLRGWMYSKPATHFDGLQGRTTAAARQILVTHVGAKSPADGVMAVDDVIVGAGGTLFTDDARVGIARAIQEAEKEGNQGILKLTRWRAGKTEEVQLKLRVMGTYAATAPYNCPKSKLILAEACKAIEKEPLTKDWCGAVNGLALLATGNPDYLPKVQAYARMIGPPTLKLGKSGLGAWEGGYRTIFLCEYYLLTGDKEVYHAIQELTVSLAKGQGMYGTFGHGFSELTAAGKLHGSIPPYGPVNQAGLPANLAIIMGAKCGVKHPEIAPAIGRASRFFGYYADKGTIPYGEHEPYPYHDNNGKSALSALLFAFQGNHGSEAKFFAKMAVAGYKNRECGHTGQGFSYLWGALGANVGGPDAAAAFFREASWHLDLVRRCDGSFTYDGGEQYGPGMTDDNTYYGKSSYSGLSPNAIYVLTYALPLKKLLVTGRDASQTGCLNKEEVAKAVASGRFDIDCKRMATNDLVAAFGDWSPIVRSWAAGELARRPEVNAMVPELIRMANGPDAHLSQGACEALGCIKSEQALPVFVRLLSHKDRWLRFKAAQAIRSMGAGASPAITSILAAVATTAEPLQPIAWADPIQLTHGQLAAALFAGPLAHSLKGTDPKLLHPAIRVVSKNADGMARATLRGYFQDRLTQKDVQALGPDILAALTTPSPADTMFSNEIRMGAYMALTKYHFREGIKAGILFAQTQGGHGSERRTGEIMQPLIRYGTAARAVIPDLKRLIVKFNQEHKAGRFPTDCNVQRVTSVEEAIKAIEAATTEPKLQSLTF